jgi:hypothetical protein
MKGYQVDVAQNFQILDNSRTWDLKFKKNFGQILFLINPHEKTQNYENSIFLGKSYILSHYNERAKCRYKLGEYTGIVQNKVNYHGFQFLTKSNFHD